MRQNPHVRICGRPGSATTLVYPTAARQADMVKTHIGHVTSEAPEWLTTLGWPRMKPAWGDDAGSVNGPNYSRIGGARWIGQERATQTVGSVPSVVEIGLLA